MRKDIPSGWVNRRQKITEQQRLQMIEDYRDGMGYRHIAAKYGISDSGVWAVMSRAMVSRDRRIISEDEIFHATQTAQNLRAIRDLPDRILYPKKSKGLPLNEDSFSTITPVCAYWLGLLMSDGNVHHGGRVANQVTLQLSKEDLYHVEEFRKFMGSGHKITHCPPRRLMTPNGMVTSSIAHHFQFKSAQVAADLARYGIVPRKSLSEKAIHVDMHPDFWRGVIDGDGCIKKYGGKGTTASFSFVGSLDLCQQFSAFSQALFPRANPCLEKVRGGRLTCVRLNGAGAAIILKILYDNDHPALLRKRALALSALENFTGWFTWSRTQL